MRVVSEAGAAKLAEAFQDMSAGKIVVVTTPEGIRTQIVRITIEAATITGPIFDFDRFDSFETIEEAKAFLKSGPAAAGTGKDAEAEIYDKTVA